MESWETEEDMAKWKPWERKSAEGRANVAVWERALGIGLAILFFLSVAFLIFGRIYYA